MAGILPPVEDGWLRLDLHVHTSASFDSLSSPQAVLARAQSLGLAGIAIADHDTFEGSQRARSLDSGLLIVPAIEYSTTEGHLLVYFLSEPLNLKDEWRDARGLWPWEAVVEQARRRAAPVFLAHGYKRRSAVPDDVLRAMDGIEAYNARAEFGPNQCANEQAQEAARRRHLPMSAGSDAHWLAEVGNATWELPLGPKERSLGSVREALLSGDGRLGPVRRSTPVFEPASALVKARKLGDYTRLPRVVAKLGLVAVKEMLRGLMRQDAGH